MLRNPKDLSLILLAILNVVLITGAAAITPWALTHLTVGAILALAGAIGLLITYLYLTNYQCISHYHIHLAYFRKASWNNAFGLFNTLALGVPQTLYQVHHQFHHKGNNDRRDPKTNSTVDFASSYRFSKDPNVEEGFLPFTLKSVFRAEITPLYQHGVKQKRRMQIHAEFLVLGAFWILLGFLSWKNFVFFYLPLWFFGQVLNYAENWLEHHGASHNNNLDNSVSSYHPVYNFLWFNNGYHQEHHYRPSIHWSELPKVKALMLDDSKRRIVPYCHLFNLPWLTRGKV